MQARVRRRIEMTLMSAAMVATGLVPEVTASARETHIECDLTGPKNQHYGYSFAFDHGTGTVLWVEGHQELKIERHTASELLVSYRGRLGNLPADAAFFDLNLFSGAAAVMYLHDPTPAEVAKCEKEQSSGCRDSIVLQQYGQTGSCTFEERGSD